MPFIPRRRLALYEVVLGLRGAGTVADHVDRLKVMAVDADEARNHPAVITAKARRGGFVSAIRLIDREDFPSGGSR